MIFFKGFNEIQETFSKENFSNVVLTIGNYDGIHLGHKKLLEKTVETAKKIGGTSVVYTFRPHPHFVLRKQNEVKLLTTYEEKRKIIEELGLDVYVEEPFTREFSNTSADGFFSEVILKKLRTKHIHVGYDFGFGKNRGGSLEILKDFCKKNQIELNVMDPLEVDGSVCSSSKIRTCLMEGDVSGAKKLLGHPFSYSEIVVKGNRRGHQLGFATANMALGNKVHVKEGVYATSTTTLKDGKTYFSITNVGRQPTFNAVVKDIPTIAETHILDFNEDIYGEKIKVEFFTHLRDEKKFSGKDELVSQIQRDVFAARQFFASSKIK